MNELNMNDNSSADNRKEGKNSKNHILIIAILTALILAVIYIFVSQFISHKKEVNKVNSSITFSENNKVD